MVEALVAALEGSRADQAVEEDTMAAGVGTAAAPSAAKTATVVQAVMAVVEADWEG